MLQNALNETCPHPKTFLLCIIQREVLCKTVLNMNHVTSTAVRLVNFIRARGLNHRQFISLLQDLDAERADVPQHSSVRWLSLGEAPKRVWDLQEEILVLLGTKDIDLKFPQLKDENWKADLAFVVEVLEQLKT